MNDSYDILPGLRLPFFPMRPTTGRTVFTEQALCAVFERDDTVFQPKLNGDNVCIAMLDGDLLVQNRHGSWFKHPVNLAPWLKLPNKTVLSGEVYNKEFYPFEAVAVAGQDYREQCPLIRIDAAKRLCADCGGQWLFEPVTLKEAEVLRKLYADVHNPQWEGVVARRLGSPYTTLGSDNQESPRLFKHKWI